MERKKYLNYGIPKPTGYEQLVVGAVPVLLTLPPNTTHMLLLVQAEPVRWRADDDPTATRGIILRPGDYLDWMTSDLDFQEVLKRLSFIKDAGAGAGDAELQIQYFG